jgi:hypothetical protein
MVKEEVFPDFFLIMVMGVNNPFGIDDQVSFLPATEKSPAF